MSIIRLGGVLVLFYGKESTLGGSEAGRGMGFVLGDRERVTWVNRGPQVLCAEGMPACEPPVVGRVKARL